MDIRFDALGACDLDGTGVVREIPSDFTESSITGSSFDQNTLFYSAVWRPGLFGGAVAVFAPRLLNLEPFLTGDGVTLDGHRVRARRVVHRMGTSVVWFPAPRPPREIGVTVAGHRLTAPVAGPQDRAFFRGLNTIVTVSKNNELAWIEDFARYHKAVHGLQAMLFFDNGSDAYAPSDIAQTLERAGLERAMVISVHKSWGARGTLPDGSSDWRGMTLQLSLLNIARLRYLAEARAVLNCDIDELVWSTGGSIFDLARRNPLGFVQFRGVWRWAEQPEARLVRHADHHLSMVPEARCPSKWCLNPRGPLGWASWEVHRLARLPWMRVTSGTNGAGFWHFRSISKNWKTSGHRTGLPKDVKEDPALAKAFAAAGLLRPEP